MHYTTTILRLSVYHLPPVEGVEQAWPLYDMLGEVLTTWVHISASLQWRHNGIDSFSNHQPHHCLLSRLFGRRSKKTSKLRVTGLCAGSSPGTGEFPAQMASYAENVSIWWRHHNYLDSHYQLRYKISTADSSAKWCTHYHWCAC